MRLQVPDVLKREHQELRLQLESTAVLPGALGESAARLAGLLDAHARHEELFAFPLLSLLPHLVDGTIGDEMEVAGPLTERLRRELPALRREHVEIAGAIEALGEAARRAGDPDCTRLAHDLLEHARLEEAILYPAALIVGEYVRLRLRERAALPAR